MRGKTKAASHEAAYQFFLARYPYSRCKVNKPNIKHDYYLKYELSTNSGNTNPKN